VANITDDVATSFAGRHLNRRRDEQTQPLRPQQRQQNAALLSHSNKDVRCKPLALRPSEACVAPTFEATSICCCSKWQTNYVQRQL
jgi:hypothetical protein